jgi:hypothetical protein
VTAVEAVANMVRFLGLLIALPALWWSAGGLRMVVSGRIDERRRSASSLILGLPLLIVAILLIISGTWLANWARMP